MSQSEEEGECVEHDTVQEINYQMSFPSSSRQRGGRRSVKSRLGGYSVEASSSRQKQKRKRPMRRRLGRVNDRSITSVRKAGVEDYVGDVSNDFLQSKRPVKERLGFKRSRPLSPERKDEHTVSKILGNVAHHERRGGYSEFEIVKKKQMHILQYKQLQNLSRKNPHELVTFLASGVSGFSDKLVDKLDPDWIQLLAEVLAIACSVDFQESKTIVLSQANEVGFLSQIEDYVMKLPFQIKQITFSDTLKLLQNLSIFFKTSVNLLPNTARDKLVGIVDNTVQAVTLIEALPASWVFPDSLKECLMNLQHQLSELVADKTVQCQKTSVGDAVHKYFPPNDFRDISVFPTLDDIVNKRPFLRANIVKGSYENENHYLDVQFRLLREDFVRPLRDGINEFMEQIDAKRNEKSRRISNIRTYRNVIFLHIKIHKGTVCFVVSLERKNIRIGKKRLIFGSLLCFTADNFKNIFFGTVFDRDGSQLLVELKNVENTDDVFDKRFIMVESEVYFEPYYHVLKALQNMKCDAFPMKRYIISAQSVSSRPGYVQENVKFTIDRHTVTLLDDSTWPCAAQLNLNDSQYAAFKSALTRELVVIQGPPGTGKTFLGLKIARVLLENASVWNTNGRPILVVCYTNHALDQFLEGLVSVTDRIVRVGSRSKNPALHDFQLTERRKFVKFYSSAMYEKREKIRASMKKMEEIETLLKKFNENKCLVSPSWLVEIGIWNPEYAASINLNDSLLIRWLAPDLRVAINKLSDLQAQITGDYSQIQNESSSYYCNQHATQSNLQSEEVTYNPWHYEPEDDFTLDPINVELKHCLALDVDDLKLRLTQVNVILQQYDTNTVSLQLLQYMKCLCNELNKAMEGLRCNLGREWLRDGVGVVQFHHDIWELSVTERWKSYTTWVRSLTACLHKMLRECQRNIQKETKLMEEVRNMKDLEVMKKCLVVGMTTTGAARLQTLLGALKPRIVIVEEAAEVMEAHLTVSLTEECQHLIMIGDHQQLRPKTAVYHLSRDYNFDVSLFERMLRNGMNSAVLKVQHRMRPEIASLVTPTIYPELHNHKSVLSFKNIKGVTKNLFFITHSHPEEEARDTESHINVHEAKFLLSLARYFVYQGYRPDQITLLTTYSGQMFKAKDLCKEYESTLQDLNIVVVDNYQGEENDIILLSLVRSNKDAKIGFLKTENRVCVALSRAKRGLFIMGNMDNLVASSEIWPKMKATLETQGAVGTELELRCEVHPDKLTPVSSSEDFHKVPEGGCNQPCGAVLSCGHTCSRICHVTERKHSKYKCREPCTRNMCVLMHQCPQQCWQQCGKCVVEVLRTLPCGHTATLPCHVDHISYLCQRNVTRELLCGHEVDLLCHVDYTAYACQVKVQKELQCGHQATVLCSDDLLVHRCKVKVLKQLSCGHEQNIQCYINPETFRCSVKVTVTLPDCGHEITKPCHEDVTAAQTCCKAACDVRLQCGHSCNLTCHTSSDPDHLQYICKKPCTRLYANCSMEHACDAKCFQACRDCPVKVRKKAANCEHLSLVTCSTPQDKIVCTFKCGRILECGHPCKLKCAAPCGECSFKVKKRVEECGHEVDVTCSQTPTVKMCSKPCTKKLACDHSCTKRCCDPCTERCVVKVPSLVVPACLHTVNIPCYLRGKNFSPTSFELLSYCSERCRALLQCGHRCSGTCGNCLQGRVHTACKEKCSRTLICGHLCSSPCSTSCPPCDQRCNMYRCKHSRCTRSCGVPCYPCKEYCEWSCPHLRCTRRCHEPCNRKPCQQPCTKNLQCGHPCIGFCGEACPPLCRTCHTEQVTEIFFGYEDEENARFVYLEDCRHVLESRGLEEWMKQSDGFIKLKECPVCRTPITRTQRYMNEVKVVYKDVTSVKKKLLGDENIVAEQQTRLIQQVCDIPGEEFLRGSRYYRKLVQKLLWSLEVNSRHPLSTMEVENLRVLVELVQDLADTCVAVLANLTSSCKDKLLTSVNLLFQIIFHRGKKISEQEVEDIKLELKRFHRFSQLLVLESEPMFGCARGKDANVDAAHEKANKIASCIEKYDHEQDGAMTTALKELKTALKSAAVITDRERQEIVAAIGMKQGHWFKCPKGHPYVITECGGAMQISRCNECGANIGGTDHRLLSDNRLASEMDQAARPAWPQ